MRELLLLDSGSGALAVLRTLLPLSVARVTVLADLAGQPYGTRSPEFVRQRVRTLLPWIRARQSPLIVACNTTWAVARDLLDGISTYAIGDAGRRLLERAPFRRILVLATPLTVRAGIYARAPEKEILQLPCQNWVEVVERGGLSSSCNSLHPSLQEVARAASRADAIFLGCTHYPLLESALLRLNKPLLDPAHELRSLLPAGIRGPGQPEIRLAVTAPSSRFRRLAARLLATDFRVEVIHPAT